MADRTRIERRFARAKRLAALIEELLLLNPSLTPEERYENALDALCYRQSAEVDAREDQFDLDVEAIEDRHVAKLNAQLDAFDRHRLRCLDTLEVQHNADFVVVKKELQVRLKVARG